MLDYLENQINYALYYTLLDINNFDDRGTEVSGQEPANSCNMQASLSEIVMRLLLPDFQAMTNITSRSKHYCRRKCQAAICHICRRPGFPETIWQE